MGWVYLHDERGKLRAKWNLGERVLEIGARGKVADWRDGIEIEDTGWTKWAVCFVMVAFIDPCR